MTILLTTHDLDEADALADRILVMDDGRIVADAAQRRGRSAGGSGRPWSSATRRRSRVGTAGTP